MLPCAGHKSCCSSARAGQAYRLKKVTCKSLHDPFPAAAAQTCWLDSCCCCAPAQVLWDMKARPNSPDWLVEETAKIRKVLLTLRQNLVLVSDPEIPEALYPRCGCSAGLAILETTGRPREGTGMGWGGEGEVGWGRPGSVNCHM